ncbi:MAG: PEGA domain-containing protein [Candidatus Saccharimonadales bacterium]
MHKISPKRKQLLERVLVYTAMVTVVVGTTWVLFFLMMGYRFNAVEGEFEQGGLAQFITRPNGATVTVGSAKLAAKTPSKITLNPGSYEVKMEIDGYRPWMKDVSISAGQVLWLNSVRFVPQKPETESAFALTGFGSMAARSQGNLVTVVEDATKPTISLFDIGGQKVTKKTVTIPDALFTVGTTHAFILQTLAQNDQYVLMRHAYDDKQEILAVDVKDTARSFVLKAGESSLADVKFDPRSGDRVYGRTAEGAIHSVNLPNKEVSEAWAIGTEQFSFVGDRLLLYTGRDAKQGVVTVNAQRLGETRAYRIESLKTVTAVQVAGGYYYGDLYIAAAVDKTMTLWKTENLPSDGVLDSKEQIVVNQILLKEAPSSVSMRGSGRFVFAELTQSMMLYDIELKKSSANDFFVENRTPALVRWLDEYHYWYQVEGKLSMSEFDGSNIHQLAMVDGATDAVLSSSGRYLYSVGRDDNGILRLQRTIMILR